MKKLIELVTELNHEVRDKTPWYQFFWLFGESLLLISIFIGIPLFLIVIMHFLLGGI